MKIKVNYKNSNVCQIIQFSKPKKRIGNFVKESDGVMVDVNTGTAIKSKKSKNKKEAIKSTKVSLNKAYELVKNNFLSEKTVYSIDVTFTENPSSYDEYMRILNNLTKALKRINKDTKYIFFKEIGEKGRYHAHLIMSNICITEDKFRTLWKYGKEIRFKEINNEKGDLDENVLYKGMYLTNVTGKSKNATKKRNNLEQFPINKHLYMCSKNLEKPIYEVVRDEEELKDAKIIFETEAEKVKRYNYKMTTYKIA